jgi:lysophospholipase L1-like esterase
LTRTALPLHDLQGYTQIEGSSEQRSALLWFHDMAYLHRTPFFVVIFPLFDDDYSQAESTYIKSLLEELNIDYLDLLPELQKQDSLSALSRDLYHPNDRGHKYAAEAILRYLKSRHLLP